MPETPCWMASAACTLSSACSTASLSSPNRAAAPCATLNAPVTPCSALPKVSILPSVSMAPMRALTALIWSSRSSARSAARLNSSDAKPNVSAISWASLRACLSCLLSASNFGSSFSATSSLKPLAVTSSALSRSLASENSWLFSPNCLSALVASFCDCLTSSMAFSRTSALAAAVLNWSLCAPNSLRASAILRCAMDRLPVISFAKGANASVKASAILSRNRKPSSVSPLTSFVSSRIRPLLPRRAVSSRAISSLFCLRTRARVASAADTWSALAFPWA